MKAHVQKQTRPQPAAPLQLNRPSQHTSCNQGASTFPHAQAEPHSVKYTSLAPTGFAHDFSRIPVYSRAPVRLRAKLMVNAPGDIYEQEADRVAQQVTTMPEPELQCTCGGGCGKCRNEQAADERLQTKRVPEMTAGEMVAPPIVHQVLASPGRTLETSTRTFMESRFGHDFGQVRVHADGEAARAASAVKARAYTVGSDIVFGYGEYAPATVEGKRLLAHELVHVVQQGAGVSSTPGAPGVQREEPQDAGVPPVAGVPEPPTLSQMSDAELGPALMEAQKAGDTDRVEAIEAEMEKRVAGWGTAIPPGPEPVTAGRGAVTPEVALKFLDNMASGQHPWKPSEGLGGSAWFTTEGNPYTATVPAKSINVEVEISKGSNPLVFKEADLIKIYDAEAGPATLQAEAEYRAKFNIDPLAKLSNRAQKAINRVLSKGGGRGGLIEKRMWTRIGEKVAASANKVGEVVLEPGSRFSETPGKFAVVADASKITLKGGTGPVVDALSKAGVTAEPVVVEAAEALAKKMKWAGRVRGVFRYGGRVLIVVGVTMDIVNVYRAKDKVKAVLTSVGGWTGAVAAGAAFAAWWTPADVAGPWAWLGHGVGTLVAGGVGYWVGSETTRYIYELAVEP